MGLSMQETLAVASIPGRTSVYSKKFLLWIYPLLLPPNLGKKESGPRSLIFIVSAAAWIQFLPSLLSPG